MKQNRKVLMVTSELYPFAQTGGLGDAVRFLSAALCSLGDDVRVVMPKYSGMNALPDSLQPLRQTRHTLQLATQAVSPVVVPYRTHEGVTVYFLEVDALYSSGGIYGVYNRPSTRDSATRFVALGRCAAAINQLTGWKPDIVHAHDWPSALAPVYVRHARRNRTPTVLTIHNHGYTGTFSRHEIHQTLLEARDFGIRGAEGQISFLHAGMRASDVVTTVSPTYAKELAGSDLQEGDSSEHIVGILNGVDYNVWSPSTDEYIPVRYDVDTLQGKEASKRLLAEKCGFPTDEKTPIIGMVSRLAAQKGFESLCGEHGQALQTAVETLDANFVILGTGDEHFEKALETLSAVSPRISYHNAFDQSLSHLIEAGSDFFLMPSTYEPCGLNQLYSFRYGTLPIVTKTGGLADTVHDFTDQKRTNAGPGIVLNGHTEGDILEGLRRAIELYTDQRQKLVQLQKICMRLRFTWFDAAREYAEIYESLL